MSNGIGRHRKGWIVGLRSKNKRQNNHNPVLGQDTVCGIHDFVVRAIKQSKMTYS